MAETTSVPFDAFIVWGTRIQLTDDNTVVEIPKKGVAEFEEFTQPILKEKMGLNTRATFMTLRL